MASRTPSYRTKTVSYKPKTYKKVYTYSPGYYKKTYRKVYYYGGGYGGYHYGSLLPPVVVVGGGFAPVYPIGVNYYYYYESPSMHGSAPIGLIIAIVIIVICLIICCIAICSRSRGSQEVHEVFSEGSERGVMIVEEHVEGPRREVVIEEHIEVGGHRGPSGGQVIEEVVEEVVEEYHPHH